MRIALAGNPNSGKTSLYNAITGKNEHVGNWAGVTVDKREAKIKKAFSKSELIAVDLPGAYSMSPFTSEESVTSEFVRNANLDAIINIVDSTNLSRSLFFTSQLLELGIPVVIALNKSDLNKKKNNVINAKALSDKLGCPVVETSSTKSKGMKELVLAVEKVVGKTQKAPYLQKEIDLNDKNAVKEADKERFDFVNGLVSAVEKRGVVSHEESKQDKLDKIIAHRWLGIPIFAVVMFGVFFISQSWLGSAISEILVGWIDAFKEVATGWMSGASDFMQALVLEGIIGGVGAVVGFLPLVMVMYFLIALLEDCGYMARVAVVMDRFFKKVGLSGKSIIPMVIGTGCAIPGVMACRTIRDEREKRTTAMLAPFMPCGAKIPVISLFAGAFFPGAGWVSPTMYFCGVLFVFFGALIVTKITGHKVKKSYFIMELPEYKIPSLKRAVVSMLERAKAFIIKAGTVILICNAVVQIMQSFDWSLNLVEEGMAQTSILASIAGPFAWLMIPLGFGVWQLAAAAVTGCIAKENVVGTLAVVFAMTSFIDPESMEIIGGASQIATMMGLTQASALAYLMFNLFTPPCFAAIGAMSSEMKSKKWLWGGIGLQLSTGYCVAFFVYQIGTLLATGSFGTGFVQGLIFVSAIIGFVVYLMVKGGKKAELSLKKRAM